MITHPLKGTCVPGCELYGYCHHGCGQRTRIARWSSAPSGMVAHRPMTFVCWHHNSLVPPTHYRRCGISVSRLRPELEVLLRGRGDARRLARGVGMSEAWVSNLRKGRIARVRLSTAARITELAKGARAEVRDPVLDRERKNAQKRRSRAKAAA